MIFKGIYAVAVLWVFLILTLIMKAYWLVYERKWLQTVPERCMRMIDRAFDWILDSVLGKGEAHGD